MPLKMYYKTKIYHRESGYDVLCADVISAEVNVFEKGIPDCFGSEFLFHYDYKGDEARAKADPSLSNPEWNLYVLKCSLSNTNGWGHNNCKCFTPLSGYSTGDGSYLEEE